MALTKCRECGHDVSTEAVKCPNCGAPVKKLAETFIPAAQIPKPKKGPTGTRLIIISLAVIGVLLLLAKLGSNPPDNQTSSQTGQENAGAEKSKQVVSESCDELSRMFGPQSNLSDLQKDELWKNYKGKAFKWPLRVTEVSSDAFGGYTVQYKCGVNSPSFIQDIQLKYDESRKPFVIQLRKGQVYEIGGVLNSQSTLLGMSGDDLP
jgi:zinc ribbon protein